MTFVRFAGTSFTVSTPFDRFEQRWNKGLRSGRFFKAYRVDTGAVVWLNPRLIVYATNHRP